MESSVIERWSRTAFVTTSTLLLVIPVSLALLVAPYWWGALAFSIPYTLVGYWDMLQRRHTLRRNFPVLGWARYLAESIRPEMRQYFVESDTDGVPFPREKRSVVYQRAKGTRDTVPFGTKVDVYRPGYAWINHSLHPRHIDPASTRVRIGGPDCSQPYDASLLNISAMSYGALSQTAIRALNVGAWKGRFYHNTGEGSISPYHKSGGADLVWQIGTGYFGCRKDDGTFDPGKFAEKAALDTVKMIEIKLSQGAKPAHGGILPAAKLTPEIAKIRGVEMGVDVISPSAHTAFNTATELLQFVAELRALSNGKPVGIKFCVGHPTEAAALVRAMLTTGIAPDFVTVDGAEGGTGAAPLEFANSIGMPLEDGLSLIHNLLRGAGLRDKIRIIAAAKITTGFHLVATLALGADLCNAARPMMLALGCIQALRCDTNACPAGIATQDPRLYKGLDVSSKADRVYRFHAAVVKSACEILGAAGLEKVTDLQPHHILRRINQADIQRLSDIYPVIPAGSLLQDPESITLPMVREAWLESNQV